MNAVGMTQCSSSPEVTGRRTSLKMPKQSSDTGTGWQGRVFLMLSSRSSWTVSKGQPLQAVLLPVACWLLRWTLAPPVTKTKNKRWGTHESTTMFDHMREAVGARGEKYISFLNFTSAELLIVPLQPMMDVKHLSNPCWCPVFSVPARFCWTQLLPFRTHVGLEPRNIMLPKGHCKGWLCVVFSSSLVWLTGRDKYKNWVGGRGGS